MKKKILNPAGLYRHPGFSRVVTVEGPMRLIFVAGQTPSDESYRCVAPGDLRAQYIRVMENLQVLLRKAGATWDDVLYRRTFVLDVDAYMEITKDPATPRYYNPERMPGSTMIGVTRLSSPDFLIEVDLVAAVPATRTLQGKRRAPARTARATPVRKRGPAVKAAKSNAARGRRRK